MAGSRSAKTLICLAVDGDEVGSVGDLVLEVAEDGVVLEQVGEGGRGGEVVYGDEFDVRVAECAAEDVASDAAEAVDAYLYCHDFGCSCRGGAKVFMRFIYCRTRRNGLHAIRTGCYHRGRRWRKWIRGRECLRKLQVAGREESDWSEPNGGLEVEELLPKSVFVLLFGGFGLVAGFFFAEAGFFPLVDLGD